MGRRIRWLGIALVVCFGSVIVQLVNIQYAKGPALSASADNPRNEGKAAENFRGDIYASDGTLLAKSVKSSSGTFDYTREYPGGALYAQIVGFDSTYEGTTICSHISSRHRTSLRPSGSNRDRLIPIASP
jgi:peptidoglycan glycosyltransferase